MLKSMPTTSIRSRSNPEHGGERIPRQRSINFESMTQRETDLEHELSAALIKVDSQRELLRLAKEENEEKRKDIVWTMGERAKLMDRIKQLEDIITRASSAFFSEGSDKETAVSMLTILEESR